MLEGEEIANLYFEEHHINKNFGSYPITMESLAKLDADVNIRELIARHCNKHFQKEVEEYYEEIAAEAKERFRRIDEKVEKKRKEIMKSDLDAEGIAKDIETLNGQGRHEKWEVRDWQAKMICRALINQVISSINGEWRKLSIEKGK